MNSPSDSTVARLPLGESCSIACFSRLPQSDPSQISAFLHQGHRTANHNIWGVLEPTDHPNKFYTFYSIHNYHFVVYGAMFDGQSEVALRTARETPKQVPQDMLKEMTDFLVAFMPTPLHVLVRFGRWEDILVEPEPAEYLPMSRSIWHYARAIAFASTGKVQDAEEEQKSFQQVSATVPETSILFNNTSRDILGVAGKMMAGEIAYRKCDHKNAFALLREAVRLDDALNYDEPWGWMQPGPSCPGGASARAGKTSRCRICLQGRPEASSEKRLGSAWAC